MTPKSLLRHPLAASTPRDLSEGSWHAVIDDAEAEKRRRQVRRVVLCSGKVYVDLVTNPLYKEDSSIAILRLEQLYPFPDQELADLTSQYENVEQIIWLQEEPENMGAWGFVRPCLTDLFEDKLPLRYIGRLPSSSPAEGSMAQHNVNQKKLIEKAFAKESEDVAV
jgi:2-oxoglutarate dehydrogenase E1 component